MADTSILFVETRSSEQRLLLCRWVEHLVEQGENVQVAADSTMAAQQLDAMLWTFSQGGFIPHRIHDASSSSPLPGEVMITTGETVVPACEVLVADGSMRLDFMKRFRWAIHFVLMDDTERRQESRLIWQEARDQGMTPRHVPYAARLPALG
jgi:DNA polymerase IIIc chi subunit